MKILTRETHVNGWFPAAYMCYTSQNFRLFLVGIEFIRSKLSNCYAHDFGLTDDPGCR